MKISKVSKEDSDIRLDRWFARHFPDVGQAQLQKALRNKLVKVDGKRAEAGQRVQTGQEIKHPEFVESVRPKAGVSKQDADWIRSMVMYEDESIIVLNKPSGLATQGGSGLGDQHIDAFLPALADKNGKSPKLVHRLDKDTSGILLLARDAKSADILMKMFAGKETQKTYWALVAGVPTPLQGKIDAPLVKQGRAGEERMQVLNLTSQQLQQIAQKGKAERIAAGGGLRKTEDVEADAKRAITEYRVIETLARKMSWVELKPLTGRTHQLRAHMEHLGHPIYGDGKYFGTGEEFSQDLNLPWQLHLHARQIFLPNFNGKDMEFTAPLPDHMRESWSALGLLTKGM
jgi:23S rRNA pseudouridine955/2504/2580 synthase